MDNTNANASCAPAQENVYETITNDVKNISRRDFLKTSLLATGAVALSGCNKEVAQNDELEIIPKQTATYEFSTPLPFNYKTIDDIIALNSTLNKSQVTTFYNNAPNQDFNNWISIDRAKNDFIKTYDDFAKFVKYAIGNGFKFSYLMNSPKPFSQKDFNTFKDEFLYLLDFLYKIGVRDIKVANTQVASIINQFAPNTFNLSASTAFEYHNVSQYHNLFLGYPNFDLIDVSNDENQNFKFLKSLRKAFPDKKLELMVNEFCIKGCPARISHISEDDYFQFECTKMKLEKGILYYFFKTGAIYPWNLEYYSSIGINNFKFISSNGSINNLRSNFHDITSLQTYLTCVENGTNGFLTSDFINKMFDKLNQTQVPSNSSKLSDLQQYLPDIRHFVAHGHECTVKCGVECNYCELCAKRTENFLLG